MAYSSQGEDARLAALCSRLGRLWTPKPIEVWEDEAPETPPSGQLLLPAVPSEIPQQTPPMEARPTQQLHSSPEPMVLFPSHPLNLSGCKTLTATGWFLIPGLLPLS